LAESGKLSVSDRTRRPSATTTRIVAQALRGGEPYPDDSGIGPLSSFAWPMLIQAAGLAELRGSRLALTNAGSESLAAPAADVLRKIWDRWLATRLLDELSRIEVIKGQTGKGKRGLTAVASRRQAISDALAECPIGRWVATDELFRYMRAVGHRFEVTRDPWRLYIGDPEYGSLGYDGYGGWNILQARYALCVLFEYTATLGIVDVAYVPPAGARPDYHDMCGTDHLEYLSRYDGLAFISLTSLGAYILGRAQSYEPPAPEHRPVLTLLANLDIVATGDGLTVADRIVLERYAQRTADRVWRLDREMLLAAAEQGESMAEVRTFLAARAVTPLPPAVLSVLDDVADRTQRLIDRGAMRVIDCADPALVLRLANDRATRKLCIAAGENRLLVPVGSEQAFRRAVRRLGYAVPVADQRRVA
jgi:Helicase conserved C-terminal domain